MYLEICEEVLQMLSTIPALLRLKKKITINYFTHQFVIIKKVLIQIYFSDYFQFTDQETWGLVKVYKADKLTKEQG